MQAVRRSPVFIIITMVWISAAVILYTYKPASATRAGLAGLTMMASVLVLFLLRALLVRREIRIIAAELHASTPFPEVT